MPVRREGFLGAAECLPGDAVRTWERALLDPHASIRELARYSMGRVGAFDAAVYYRQKLAEGGVTPAMACGLAECGDAADLPWLRGLTSDPRPKFRRAAIRGLARIAGAGVAGDLVGLLKDRSPSVAREAQMQLEPFSDEVSGGALFAVLRDGGTELTRRCALRAILARGKWGSLPWLIRAASHPDEATASEARRLVEAWFTPPSCNRVFTRPSPVQRLLIEEAVSELPGRESDQFVVNLRKWVGEA